MTVTNSYTTQKGAPYSFIFQWEEQWYKPLF